MREVGILNSAARNRTETSGRRRTAAAFAALLLSTTALPALAAVTDGATLEVALDAASAVATQRPGAGQVVQAPPDRTTEHVLPDGTALTLSPGSSLTITRYEYDPDRRAGELGLELGSGLFRIAGGAINNASPIGLSTGGGAQVCELALANGTAVVAAGPTGAVRTYLVFGERLTVTSGGETATLVRPGFQLASACQEDAPEESPLSEAQLSADLIQLNPGLLAALEPGADDEESDTAEVIRAVATEDQRADETGPDADGPGDGANGFPGRIISAALDSGEDLGPGTQLGAVNQNELQTSSSASNLAIAQVQEGPGDAAPLRNFGLTTNTIISSGEIFNQTVSLEDPVSMPTRAQDVEQVSVEIVEDGTTLRIPQTNEEGLPVIDSSDRIAYIFVDAGGTGDRGNIGLTRPGTNIVDGVVLATVFDTLETPDGDATIIFPGSGEVLQFPLQERIPITSVVGSEIPAIGEGGDFLGPAETRLLQSGFMITDTFEVSRNSDNFLAVQVRPLQASRVVRDDFIGSFQVGGGGDKLKDAHKIDISTEDGLLQFWAAVIPFQDLDEREQSALEDQPGAFIVKEPPEGLGENLARQIAERILVPEGSPSGENSPTLLAEEELAGFGLSQEFANRLLARMNAPVEGTPGTTNGTSFLFAAGDVDGERDPTFTVDKFFISPGLDNFERRDGVAGPSVVDTIRAFLRRETAFDHSDTPQDESIDLTDTGILVVNPGSGSEEAQTALLHADLGVEGENEQQRSTISITIGEVLYGQPNPQTEGEDLSDFGGDDGNEVLVNAHTFGSSRDNTERDPETDRTPASTFISSALFNTAAGGGNPDLTKGDGLPPGTPEPADAEAPREGRVGYIVFENFSPESLEEAGGTTAGNRIATGVHTGGLEDPVDPLDASKEEQQYAILRLGTAVGSLKQIPDADLPHPNEVNTRSSQALEGFAAGIGEFQTEDDIGVVPVDAGIPVPTLKPLDSEPLAPNLQIETSRETNQVHAVMRIVGLDDANDASQPVVLGGLGGADTNGLSAFADDDTFGARTPAGDKSRGEYAMVTALSLTKPTGDPAVRELPELGEVPVLKHTQWGFFLGERLAKFDGRDVREHAHLGAWAAGEKLRDDALGGWSGTATYEGIAAGNVFRGQRNGTEVTGGNLSTVVGSYRNQWDFGARAGNVDMSFDQANYTGETRLEKDSARFVGTLESSKRSGRLDGSFVGKVTDFSDGTGRGPTGLAGQFSINEKGAGTELYRATGVVAADRKEK